MFPVAPLFSSSLLHTNIAVTASPIPLTLLFVCTWFAQVTRGFAHRSELSHSYTLQPPTTSHGAADNASLILLKNHYWLHQTFAHLVFATHKSRTTGTTFRMTHLTDCQPTNASVKHAPQSWKAAAPSVLPCEWGSAQVAYCQVGWSIEISLLTYIICTTFQRKTAYLVQCQVARFAFTWSLDAPWGSSTFTPIPWRAFWIIIWSASYTFFVWLMKVFGGWSKLKRCYQLNFIKQCGALNQIEEHENNQRSLHYGHHEMKSIVQNKVEVESVCTEPVWYFSFMKCMLVLSSVTLEATVHSWVLLETFAWIVRKHLRVLPITQCIRIEDVICQFRFPYWV